MKNLLVKLLGPLLAIAGVLGLTGSSILWNFQGRNFGIPATIVSLLLLATGVVLLRPLAGSSANETQELAIDKKNISAEEVSERKSPVSDESQSEKTDAAEPFIEQTESTTSESQQKPSLTTAQAIADELAAADAARAEVALVNFAPEALQAGNSLRQNKRTPGKNLTGFRDMATELFKTN